MISMADVSWTYAASAAPSLVGIDLDIVPGEVVGLCGASGSGKSSLLRLMNGLVPHFHEGTLSGTVTVAGLDVASTPLEQLGRRTGTVLQHPRRQFFTSTVVDEVSFALENFGIEPADIQDRAVQTMRQVGVLHLAEAPLAALSGGQQQRVAIAAALAHQPQLLLLDEPSSNLSHDVLASLRQVLERLAGDGVTIVVSEHRLHYLAGLLDRVIVLGSGHVGDEWSGAEFAGLPDNALVSRGLRGTPPPPRRLEPVAAIGASVEQGRPPTPAEVVTGLHLRGVRCRLRGRTVLSVEEALLPRGAVTAVRGPNGAGKTTLARVVIGLQRHTGTISLDGEVLSRLQRQRLSAIVMQDVQRQLFTDSVRAEMELAARGRSEQMGREDQTLPAQLAAFDLSELVEQHPLALSGGQQQRLVVAATQYSGARVVVFDEPSSGVDRRHLRSITAAIRRCATPETVVLLISHDEDLLHLAADRQLDLVAHPPDKE